MYPTDLRPISISLPNLKFAYTLPFTYQIKGSSSNSSRKPPTPAAPLTNPKSTLSRLAAPPPNSTSPAPTPTTSPVLRSPTSAVTTVSIASTENKEQKGLYQSHELLSYILDKLSACSVDEVVSLSSLFWDVIYIAYFKQHSGQNHEWVHLMRKVEKSNIRTESRQLKSQSTLIPQRQLQPRGGAKGLPSSPHPRSKLQTLVQIPILPQSQKQYTKSQPSTDPIGWSFGILLGRWVRIVPCLEVVFLPITSLVNYNYKSNHPQRTQSDNEDTTTTTTSLREEMKQHIQKHFTFYNFSQDSSCDTTRTQVAAVQAGMKICFFTWDGQARQVVDLDLDLDLEVDSEDSTSNIKNRAGEVLDLIDDADIVDFVVRGVRDRARGW